MVSRRRVLQGGAAGAGLMAAPWLLGACGGDDDNNSNGNGGGAPTSTPAGSASPGASETPKSGGEVVLRWSDLQRLDFQRTISTPAQYSSSLVFSRLLAYDPYTSPNSYELVSDLAESWEQVGDEVIFKLRKDVNWQDLDPVNGRPLTSEDIKYSLERVSTNEPDYVHAYKVDPVDSVSTPDPHTVVMKLKFPSAGLLADLASGQGMGIVPRELVEADGDLDTRWVGTGPFMLDRWEKGSRIRFVKNPNYFRTGQPYLDSVEVQFIADESTALANFISKKLHYFSGLKKEDISRVESSTGAKVQSFTNLGGNHKMYNVGPDAPPELRDVRVRQAIDLAIDRGLILDVVLGGDGVWAGPFLPVGFGDWTLDEEEIKKLYAPDIQKAKALLEQAGVSNLTLEAQYSNTDTTAAGEFPLMKQSLAAAGINLELKPLERTIYLDNQVKGAFGFQGISMGGYPDPDNFLYPVFHSEGSKNYGHAADSKLDALIDEQRRMLDVDERRAFIHDMQRDWQEYLYRTYTVNPNVHSAWLPEVRGTFNTKGWDWKGMEGVWLA